MKSRNIEHVIHSQPTSDGAGVKLRRSLGSQRGLHVDPFLMLDEFYSDDPNDYIAGFPPHPHRGFETVTYMLDGHMRHEDHLGNRGDLGPGDVQWMTAARGIIHSEMPQQTAGRMRGFQLWLNLPAREKMKPAAYQDIPSARIPVASLPNGGSIKVIAGRVEIPGGSVVAGPINDGATAHATDPLYLDLRLPAGAELRLPLAAARTGFLYVYEGSAEAGPAGAARALPHRSAGVMGDGDVLELRAGPEGAQVLLLAARPLGEPVVQYGPFVMNTRQEIEQAIADYNEGRFGSAA